MTIRHDVFRGEFAPQDARMAPGRPFAAPKPPLSPVVSPETLPFRITSPTQAPLGGSGSAGNWGMVALFAVSLGAAVINKLGQKAMPVDPDELRQDLQLQIDDLQQKIRIARFNHEGGELIPMWQGLLMVLGYQLMQMFAQDAPSIAAKIFPSIVNAAGGEGGGTGAGSAGAVAGDDASMDTADTDPDSLLEKLTRGLEPGTIEHDLVSAITVGQIDREPAFLLTRPLHELVADNLDRHDYTLLGAIGVFADALHHWTRVILAIRDQSYHLVVTQPTRGDVTALLQHQAGMEREAAHQIGQSIATLTSLVASTLILAAGILYMAEDTALNRTIVNLLFHRAYRRFGIIAERGNQMRVIRSFADLKETSSHPSSQDAIYDHIWGDVNSYGEEGVRDLLDFVERSGDGLASYLIHMSLSHYYRILGFKRVADYHESVAKDFGNEAVFVADMDPDTALRMVKKIKRRARRFAEDSGLNGPKMRAFSE